MGYFTHAQTVSTRPLLGEGGGGAGNKDIICSDHKPSLQAQKPVVNVMICILLRLAGFS